MRFVTIQHNWIMSYFDYNDETSSNNLRLAIQKFRENRERLIKLQFDTEQEFNKIIDILKPTTSELVESVNVDKLTHVARDLGANRYEDSIDHSVDAEEYMNQTLISESTKLKKFEIGNPAIAVVGQVKAGKSAFINVLLRKNVVTQAYNACTARMTRLTYSKENFVEVLDADGKVLKKKHLKNGSIPKRFLHLKDEERNNPLEIRKSVRAGIKSKFLEYGIDIIDSPGLSENSILTHLSKNMIKSLLPVIIYVIDGRTSVKQSDISDLLELKNSVKGLQIIYFITKLDTEDLTESETNDPIQLAESKMDLAFRKLQYNNFIPQSFNHWSDCPYFHGASLYSLIDFYQNKKTPECVYHFQLFGKFQSDLGKYLLANFENKINKACNTIVNFQIDVLTKIIARAKCLSDFTNENLNNIFTIRKIEERLFDSINRLIENSKTGLRNNLVNRIKDQSNAIINPIADIEYPHSLKIPEKEITADKKVIKRCQKFILQALCIGLENVIVEFVEENIFLRYREEIESQISPRIKDQIKLENDKCACKSPYRFCLETMLLDKYTISSKHSNSKAKLHNSVLSSMKRFLDRLFRFHETGENHTVNSREWKLQQAGECLKNCDINLLAEYICKNLRREFTNKHNSFLLALECEHNSVQKKVVLSELIRNKISLKAPDFASLLMFTLDVKGQYHLQNMIEKEVIGRGAQGTVYRCVCDGKEYAKKTVIVPMDYMQNIAEEIYYSFLFEHPHLLPMIAVSITDSPKSECKQVSIYSPLKKNDLHNHLRKNKLNFEDKMKIALQVTDALQYLHRHDIMHRDLKLANILLDEQNNVFLADYGFCKSIALSQHSFVGTPIHIAPEIVRNAMYDYKVDIYSFGVLLWYLFQDSGSHPQFVNVLESNVQIYFVALRQNLRPERLREIPDELWDLMNICWDSNPKLRPEIDTVIKKLENILEDYSLKKC